MRILIVEDEYAIADAISEALKKEKYTTDVCLDGEEGLYNALMDIYDLIILDVMLPSMDGFSILKEIKNKKIKSKVIMLTAKSMLDDKLEGLENGADDYLTKPFHMEELIARVNIQLRKKDVNKNYIEVYDLKLNIKTSNLECVKTGENIDINLKEFLILEMLMNNCNQIISKDQIYDKVWGIDNDSVSNNLEAYMSFIRKKLKLIGSTTNVRVLRGLGYKMEGVNEEIKK